MGTCKTLTINYEEQFYKYKLLLLNLSIEYSERLTLANHKNFVSSVCVLDGGEWICTGSNDATICVYIAGNTEPFTILKAHESTGNYL